MSRLNWSFPDGGLLDLMPAGRFDKHYARRVTAFDWERFYADSGGAEIIEKFRRDLRDAYDYILVDSRTGINDSAGICTVQMPDKVGDVFHNELAKHARRL
jgi:hypothetical protein